MGMNNITWIPTEIGLLSNSLQVLNLMHCTVESEIPTEIGRLTTLHKLDLSENFLEGRIPSELGLLQLENLYINHNYLAGPVPPELFNLSSVKGLNFAANALSGVLPTEIGKISHVQWLNIYGNWVSASKAGSVVLCSISWFMHLRRFGKHSLFACFIVRQQQIEGPLPSELGVLHKMIALYASHNLFSGKCFIDKSSCCTMM